MAYKMQLISSATFERFCLHLFKLSADRFVLFA